MLGRVTGIVWGLALLAVLAWAPNALAVTPVTCAQLQAKMDTAAAGEVLQLPKGTCATNITEDTNTNAFTLQGATGGGTILTAESAGSPVINSAGNVRFKLTKLTFSGTTEEPPISLQGAGEAVTISGNEFVGNHYPTGFGGAISIQTFAAAATDQPTLISDNTFVDNQAADGGAIALLHSPLNLIIQGNTFVGNSAPTGGAILLAQEFKTSHSVTVTGNKFGGPTASAGNTATGLGGAAYLTLGPGQPLTMSSNLFQNNRVTGAHVSTAQRFGGALYLAPDQQDVPFPVIQRGNQFLDNLIDATQQTATPKQPEGGGAEWIQGLTVTSVGDRFVGNRIAVHDGLPAEGGAVGAFAEAPTMTTPARPGVLIATNDLFSGNSAAAGGRGGAIYVGGGPILCSTNCRPAR